MSSLEVPIFSLDASVSRKDLHVSARHKLMFPSQLEITYDVSPKNLCHQIKNPIFNKVISLYGL